MGLYILQKIMRGDFHYWFPFDGALELFVSFLMRFIVKVITDFTGIVQFRHAGELGGTYWTMNIFLSVLASFGSIEIYIADRDPEEASEMRVIAWSMFVAWLALFGVFMLLMKHEYRKTFWSRQTGAEVTRSYFLEGKSDEMKAIIFTSNKKQWNVIRDEVKAWVLQNWWKWKEEKPAWFTDNFIANVPDDMIPSEAMRNLKMAGGGERRRSSIGEMLVGNKQENKGPKVFWGGDFLATKCTFLNAIIKNKNFFC